jgi:hypothetical protein
VKTRGKKAFDPQNIRVHTKKRKKEASEGKKVYVLFSMVVTFPTFHAERLPLKALAPSNTAPPPEQKSPPIKMGGKGKEENMDQKYM